jgi:GDPmannose 4,6-dehydratase
VTGWQPKVMTPELAQIMVDADVAMLAASGSGWIDRPYDV